MGARMLRDQLLRQGLQVGRKHVATLMQRMPCSTPRALPTCWGCLSQRCRWRSCQACASMWYPVSTEDALHGVWRPGDFQQERKTCQRDGLSPLTCASR